MTMNKINDQASHPLRAMIVEDEILIAEDLKERLVGFGFCVIANVDTAEEGIAVAIKEHPDLILMDIRLKGKKDGIQAAEEIRKQIDLPIVYLTAYSDQVTVERSRQSSHDAYLLKPFQTKELQSTIDVAMKRHARRVLEKKKIQS